MRIAIIETGRPAPPLAKEYGSYADMMIRMLGPLSQQFDFFAARTFDGQPLPPVSSFDGALLTGSPAGVYEGREWIKPLEDFIRAAAAAGKPQTGICFGHQIMAQAFGGRVEKSGKGWGVGVHCYDVRARASWMQPDLSQISCAVSHQDQVVAAPSGAIVLAGSSFCPYGALSYAEGPAISFQMHPEFRHDFARALLSSRKERVTDDLYDRAVGGLRGESDRMAIARWIRNFYLT